MSYCRFSSDNWRSDVYVYEDCGGWWQTYVASNRVVGEIPPEPPWSLLMEGEFESFGKQHNAVMEFLATAKREPIGLEHDGASFQDESPAACADRLEMLRAAGYNVPQHAIDALREECTELSEREAKSDG